MMGRTGTQRQWKGEADSDTPQMKALKVHISNTDLLTLLGMISWPVGHAMPPTVYPL